jgi:V/A-type H+-transporting ATPase subunit K
MFEALPDLTNAVLSTGAAESSPALTKEAAAAIAVGLAAIATGYAQRGIGSAAVGAVAEDSDNLISGLIFTAIPETLIIIAFVTIFVV